MPAVFISYRRDDTAGSAGRVYDRLVDRFGRDQVYRDVDSGQPGEDFVETIGRRVRECDVLLALIGPAWLRAVDDAGGWRLAKDDDLVRVEIATALERGIRVIPVLLEGAKMPRAGDLPSSLARLAHRNALEIRDTHFDQDVSHLLDDLASMSALRRLLRPLARHGKWAAAAAVVAGGIGGVYLSQTAVTPEQARVRLGQMNVPYTAAAFVEAAEMRDGNTVELFLRAGMDPNAEGADGATALAWAAAHGDLTLMKTLVAAGADVVPAVAWAAGHGQVQALQWLIERGPPKATIDRALTSAYDELDAARLLLQRGADPDARDEWGWTALMRAAHAARPDVVRLLLEHGASADAAQRNDTRRTALYLAASASGDEARAIEVATLLLDKGAGIDVRVVDYNSTEGWTPLLAALKKRHWAMARLLVERGADVNARSVAANAYDERLGFGLTPLMYAAKDQQLDLGRLLLDRGARVDMRGVTGRTALSFAAEAGQAAFVEELLARGADPDEADDDGRTPLMAAAQSGNANNARVLLQGGASRAAKNRAGETALDLARRMKHDGVVEVLLE